MHISKLRLIQFKNYTDWQVEFGDGINCIVGPNGCGKTNLLDAIYYLCITKSAFNPTEQDNVQHQHDFFTLIGQFEVPVGRSLTVKASYQSSAKSKSFSVGQQEYAKLGEHIGLLPCVLFAPSDTDLIRESSEARRKFFDLVVAQTIPGYLPWLMQYNHALRQRNALLKQSSEQGHLDTDLIAPYDAILIGLAIKLAEARQQATHELSPLFAQAYQSLTGGLEEVSLTYASTVLNDDFEQRFRASLSRDVAFGRTHVGAHRDDFVFAMNGQPVKKFASQGQQKSYVVALKLAYFNYMRQLTGKTPLLLLDDIFDKLDDNRMARLMAMLHQGGPAQILITDARPERTMSLLAQTGIQPTIIFPNSAH